MQTLRVNQFTDYRAFLLAHVQDKRKSNPDWTFGVWAKTLGLKDTSSITKIIQGQRHPGTDITKKLTKYFRFTDRDSQYFNDLVTFQKVKNDPRLSVMLLEKMGKVNPDLSTRVLDDKTFNLISNWYCLAVREMVRLDQFMEDPSWMSKTFHYKVTPTECANALSQLLELGLLKRDSKGKLRVETGSYSTSNDYASEAIKRFHESSLDNAKTALRTVEVEAREFSASILAVRKTNLPQAKQLIRDFKERFESLLEEDSADAIYQLQIQFFPLTKASKL